MEKYSQVVNIVVENKIDGPKSAKLKPTRSTKGQVPEHEKDEGKKEKICQFLRAQLTIINSHGIQWAHNRREEDYTYIHILIIKNQLENTKNIKQKD